MTSSGDVASLGEGEPTGLRARTSLVLYDKRRTAPRPHGPGAHRALGSDRRAPAGEGPHDEEQDHGADEGDDDAAEVHARSAHVAEEIEDPAADECTDDTDDDVTQDAPGAFARYDPLRQNPGDKANDQPA